MALGFTAGLVCLLLLLPGQVPATDAPPGARDETGDGVLLLRPFASAPYPHSSRAQGLKIRDEEFPAALHYADSTVALFVPRGFSPGETVNFVVHFHGHRNHVSNVLKQFDLCGQFAASGVNAVLVVPQGPKNAPDSGCGKLELDEGSLTALLEEAIGVLRDEGIVERCRIGNVVLSAHSGGYKVAGAILARGELRESITDVLLFDATYGQLEAFAEFAARPNRRLVSIFTQHLADENFALLARLQAAGTPFRAILEVDLDDTVLRKRLPLLIYTPTLAHDEVVSKRNYFGRFVSGSMPSASPATRQRE